MRASRGEGTEVESNLRLNHNPPRINPSAHPLFWRGHEMCAQRRCIAVRNGSISSHRWAISLRAVDRKGLPASCVCGPKKRPLGVAANGRFLGAVYCHSTAILRPAARRRWLQSIIRLPTFHDVRRQIAFRLAARGARFVPLVPLVSLVSLVLHPKDEAINRDNRYKKRARQWKAWLDRAPNRID